jgi:hypothetical protein
LSQDTLSLPLAVENLVFNYPSMVVMYPMSIVLETVNTPVGLANTVFETDFNVPFPHQD